MTTSVPTATSPATLWYTRCPVPTAFSVAIHAGFLAREFASDGIELKSLQAATTRKDKESHFSHTLEDSFRYGGNIPPLWARSEGADTRLIGASWIDSPHVILALPESGIRTAADLAGKRLSVLRRTNDLIDFWRAGTLRTYEVALATAGLTLDDVELVDLPVEQSFIGTDAPRASSGSLFNPARVNAGAQREISALVNGEVDAIFSESFFSTQLVDFLGAHVVHDVSQQSPAIVRHNNAIPQIFTVSGRLAEQRPDLVARVLVATQDAAEWARAHREETLRIAGLEGGASVSAIDRTYPRLEQQLHTDLSADKLAALTKRKQFLLAHGFLREDFPLAQWVDERPLRLAEEWRAERAETAARRARSA